MTEIHFKAVTEHKLQTSGAPLPPVNTLLDYPSIRENHVKM